MNLALIRGDALVASPWKNGGGITREVAAQAQAWRASVADIDRPGPFSRFDGIDRVLVLLDGAGLVLGEQVVGQALELARFAGETPIDAQLTDGPVRVFNLMTQRDAARASVDIWHAPGTRVVRGDTVLLHCARGTLDVRVGETHISLTKMDTLRIEDARAIEVGMQGDGALLCASLETQVRS
ncbi:MULTISPECIES: HutD family protein [unclassified Caballeronia]|uniref:HutD/Ves family protein n=1 Tax=unclassified Caballeronia TaxID=2646786 RepID=UPI00285E0397|nr:MULTISPECIES: HutD family protein [unclassified Caballeronia]MDR5816979.1 HutD family protein [Caballeronia sp. LZ033]MDR5823887.1 HutD family protein [Caballeronia sp. LZ043]MDR5881784.1 HutD family protein [Caballeronia sp. LZ032]